MESLFQFLHSRIVGTSSPIPGTPPSRLAEFYWFFLRQHKAWYLTIVVTMFSVAFLDLMIPVSIGKITSLLQADDPIQVLRSDWLIYLTLMTLVVIVRPIAQICDLAFRLNVVVPGLSSLVRWQAHRHMSRQSWPFFQNDFAGRLANRVMQTASAIRDSVLSTIRAVLYVTIYGTTTLVILLFCDWRLALPTLIWIVAYLAFLKRFVPRLLELSKSASEERSLLMGRIVDSYTNFLTVKLFARLKDEDAYVRETMDSYQNAVCAHSRNLSFYLGTLQLLNAFLISATAILGLILWMQGYVSAAVVTTAVPLVWQITNMSGWVSFEIAGIFENIGIVQEGMQSIATPHNIVDSKNAPELELKKGEIHFKDLQFSYGSDQPVLNNINLRIRPGERVGIVGRSGAGKSTLINLLLRFYDIENGNILVDGQNIKNVTQESLRSVIGVVTQDTSLLHRSIADNIRYGCQSASDEEVEQAARRAHAHEFVNDLVDWQGRRGFQAHTGERGVKLSGGQRQRIALARVILKNAPILVLDEATSALDSEIELAIQEQLLDLMSGKTVIAIAHRLSTIARMDRLIIIDKGVIVEEGSHDELLAMNGLYAKLWSHQSGGFLAEDIPEENEIA